MLKEIEQENKKDKKIQIDTWENRQRKSKKIVDKNLLHVGNTD